MKLTKKQRKQIGEFCFSCGQRFGKADINGGRCGNCGDMISAADQEELEEEFAGLPQEIQYIIINEIGK